MRRKLLFGNWKMNKVRDEAKAFAEEAKELDKFAKAHNIDIGVAPTFLSLCAVKKVNPWLNLYVSSPDIKRILEEDVQINCPYEVAFNENMSIRQLREMEIVPETVHFSSLEDAKRAYDVIKPTPVNYNRVSGQI